MKIIAFLIIILIPLLSACSDVQSSRATPSVSIDADRFKSNEEVVERVNALKDAESDYNNVKDMKFYFEPEAIPENMKLYEIRVKRVYCWLVFIYETVDKPLVYNADDTFTQFDFVWNREMDESNLAQTMESHSSPDSHYDKIYGNGKEYYIRKVNNAVTDEKGNIISNNDFCYMVFWTQDGMVFHANVPLSFTEDDIVKYCRARKVNIVE